MVGRPRPTFGSSGKTEYEICKDSEKLEFLEVLLQNGLVMNTDKVDWDKVKSDLDEDIEIYALTKRYDRFLAAAMEKGDAKTKGDAKAKGVVKKVEIEKADPDDGEDLEQEHKTEDDDGFLSQKKGPMSKNKVVVKKVKTRSVDDDVAEDDEPATPPRKLPKKTSTIKTKVPKKATTTKTKPEPEPKAKNTKAVPSEAEDEEVTIKNNIKKNVPATTNKRKTASLPAPTLDSEDEGAKVENGRTKRVRRAGRNPE